MPRKSTDVVKRKAKAGETDWYAPPQGRLQTKREFARALKEGTLIRSAGTKIARSDRRVLEQPPKKPVLAIKPCSSRPLEDGLKRAG